METRPLFAAFEIIVERDLDQKTFYAQHELQAVDLDLSVTIGER